MTAPDAPSSVAAGPPPPPPPPSTPPTDSRRGSPSPAADVAPLARRLWPLAVAILPSLPAASREGVHAAVDGFLDAPSPSTFVGAFRTLELERRRGLLGGPGQGIARRGFDAGMVALRQVSSLPAPAVDTLVRALPVDARAGGRLRALVDLATAYQELSARVAADSDRRRRLWKGAPRRRPPRQ